MGRTQLLESLSRQRFVRISGFSFARNAQKLGYPLREALLSVLPIVDELVVAVAPGDADDDTAGLVRSLSDGRIRMIEATWDERRRQLAYSDATNAALDACTGDWCLYVQADEVVHEADHETIRKRCRDLLDDDRVEGLIFDYLHFFGDYRHVQRGQGWYRKEIRIVRNAVGIRSVRDAQSFRKADQSRLTVASAGATMFHYGWVRHPRLMQTKRRAFWSHRLDSEQAASVVGEGSHFDYGPLGRLPRWDGEHPAVMRRRIAEMDWQSHLREADPPGIRRRRHRDERLLYRLLSGFTRLTGVDLNHTNHGKVLDV